ncbi:MAG: glycosyltransferase family 39 protein [Candidatus Daviesbacteria bacterium]|nr:glycosyltransferase family 39 protein [Candidatus Daviesbacteria bacterium]
MIKLQVILLLLAITIIGAVLRFTNLTNNPPSLNIDEVAYGYSAYSILKTGKDENGKFMPIAFRSIGDYKSPVLIYSLVPSIALFGLNEFGVRFTTVLAGVLSIPLIFLLINILTHNFKISLVGAAFLSTSPWHIYYSRFASDHMMGTFFLMLGFIFFHKLLAGFKVWLPAAIFLAASMYSYHSHRLFIPLFIGSVLIFNHRIIRPPNIKAFLAIFIVLILPLIFLTLFGPLNTRAQMVFLSQDIDYTRYVILDHIEKSGENSLLFFFWAKRYLNYFQPDFLFFNGLNMTSPGTLGLGVLHLFEFPLLVLGIIHLIQKKSNFKKLIILWILIGLVPASVTNNEQSAGRSLLILPALVVVISLGTIYFFKIVKNLSNIFLKTAVLGLLTLLTFISLVHAFLVFSVYFPNERGEAFMEGTKETVLYALENKDKYREIVFDPYRGIEAQNIVNIPYMYVLFYSQYDPVKFQTEQKENQGEIFKFDKFVFRRIDWRQDRLKRGILFVGSPWSLPLQDIREEEILKKIYLTNGNLALLVVSPHPD